MILPANSSVSSVFIVGTAVRPTYGKDAGEESNVPDFLANYLVAGGLSDFLRGDGQTEAAMQEENRAEEYLALEIDRAERLQSQNKITFNTYPTKASEFQFNYIIKWAYHHSIAQNSMGANGCTYVNGTGANTASSWRFNLPRIR